VLVALRLDAALEKTYIILIRSLYTIVG